MDLYEDYLIGISMNIEKKKHTSEIWRKQEKGVDNKGITASSKMYAS